jgi:hypothetical protein
MLTNSKIGLLGCGLAAGLMLAGCSGDEDPAASPTVSASPTVEVAATPPPNTPDPNISPLGGKPATEEEKQYYRLQKKAEDMVLSRAYEEAIPLLEQAYEQRPKDMENSFYLLLSHGSLELVPSKGSAAYPYAKTVVELAPNTSEAQRANAYLIAAEFEVPKDFKYGKKTFYGWGGFVFEEGKAYKLAVESPLHTDIGPRLTKQDKALLWETEVAPKMTPDTLKLSKGTEVQLLSQAHYFHSLTSWRKPLPEDPQEFDDTIFEVNAFYVEVVSEGDNKGKKGWIVNQIDRYLNPDAEDPFGVWIPDRLTLVREAENIPKP